MRSAIRAAAEANNDADVAERRLLQLETQMSETIAMAHARAAEALAASEALRLHRARADDEARPIPGAASPPPAPVPVALSPSRPTSPFDGEQSSPARSSTPAVLPTGSDDAVESFPSPEPRAHAPLAEPVAAAPSPVRESSAPAPTPSTFPTSTVTAAADAAPLERASAAPATDTAPPLARAPSNRASSIALLANPASLIPRISQQAIGVPAASGAASLAAQSSSATTTASATTEPTTSASGPLRPGAAGFDPSAIAPRSFRALLTTGAVFLKHGRMGRPHPRFVWCSSDLRTVYWRAVGSTAIRGAIDARAITEVRAGQHSHVFERATGKAGREAACFSLIAPDRTLDLEVDLVGEPAASGARPSEEQARDIWVEAFRYLIDVVAGADPDTRAKPRAPADEPTAPLLDESADGSSRAMFLGLEEGRGGEGEEGGDAATGEGVGAVEAEPGAQVGEGEVIGLRAWATPARGAATPPASGGRRTSASRPAHEYTLEDLEDEEAQTSSAGGGGAGGGARR